MAPKSKSKSKAGRRRKGNTDEFNPKFEVRGVSIIEYKNETDLREEGVWEEFLMFKRDKEATAERIAAEKEEKAVKQKAARADKAKLKRAEQKETQEKEKKEKELKAKKDLIALPFVSNPIGVGRAAGMIPKQVGHLF